MKRDLKREMPHLFSAPRGRFEQVMLPASRYLAVDGAGNPNDSPDYRLAVEALYTAAYALKFISKAGGTDYTVPPLEGLWWADDPDVFLRREKHLWSWRMMIFIPPFAGSVAVEEAMATLARKNPAASGMVHVVTLEEGMVLQTLHVGSYDDETPVLRQLHEEIMPAGGWTFNGHHHEVYLSDPRRTAPARLKTILRQPVRQKG